MTYTDQQLAALQQALSMGERRVTFGDKTIEYRSIDELKEALRIVQAGLGQQQGAGKTRQIRIVTDKGF